MPPASKPNFNDCPFHAGHEQQLEEHERRLNKMDETVGKIFGKLDHITNRLLGRPGWIVTVIISLLTTFLGIAVTIALKKGG